MLGLALGAAVALAVGAGLLWGWGGRRSGNPGLASGQLLALASLHSAMLGQVVWRVRSSAELAENPLDAAGLLRIGFGLFALGTAAVSILMRGRRVPRGLPVPLIAVSAYLFVVLAGASVAVAPSLVLFRWLEVATLLFVWRALAGAFRGDLTLPLRHAVAFFLLLGGSALMGALVQGEAALQPVDGPIPFRLSGLTPVLSANTVGFVGLVLCVGALGGLWRSRIAKASHGLIGLALVVLAQYRTGYIGLAAVAIVWAVCSRSLRRLALMSVCVGAVGLAIAAGAFHTLWLRGDPEHVVSSFTGRMDWWTAGVDAWQRSPIIGLGLSSGTRFEVLSKIGREDTSTIHNTWIEALVGTGVLGLALIGIAFVAAGIAALRRAWIHRELLPVLMMTAIAARSVTDSTIELAGWPLVLFLLCTSRMIGLSRHRNRRQEPPRASTADAPVLAGRGSVESMSLVVGQGAGRT